MMAAMGKGSKRDTDDVTDGPTGSEQFRRLDDFSHRDRMFGIIVNVKFMMSARAKCVKMARGSGNI